MESNKEIDRPSSSTTATDSKSWLWILGGVCAAIIGYGLILSSNTTSDLAFLLGYSIPVALLIWLVLLAVLPGMRVNRWKAFFALLISLVLSQLIGYARNKERTVQLLSEMQKTQSHYIDAAKIDPNQPASPIKPLDAPVTGRGDFGVIEQFHKKTFAEFAEARNSYMLELDAIKWSKALDPDRLQKDDGLTESKIIVERAREIAKKYEQHSYALLKKMRDDAENLGISPSTKSAVLSGLDNGLDKSRSATRAMWDLETKTIDAFGQAISVLSPPTRWSVKNGQILFENQRDLERYNAQIIEIQRLAAEQADVQKQSMDEAQKSLGAAISSVQ